MDAHIGELNGQYLVQLPIAIVEELGLQKGQKLSLNISNGAMTLTPEKSCSALEKLCAVASTQTAPVYEWNDTLLESEWPSA